MLRREITTKERDETAEGGEDADEADDDDGGGLEVMRIKSGQILSQKVATWLHALKNGFKWLQALKNAALELRHCLRLPFLRSPPLLLLNLEEELRL